MAGITPVRDAPHAAQLVCNHVVQARPDVMTPASTLEDAMYTVVENHVHRVFVVEDKKPVGVVSLTDIILQFKGH